LTRVSANIPVNDQLAVRVSGFRRQDAGYIDNPKLNLRGLNESEAYGGRLSALWKPLAGLSVKLNALYQNIQAQDLSEVDVPTASYAPTLGLGDLQQNSIPGIGGYNKTIEAFSAILNADLGAYVQLKSITGYNSNRQSSTLNGSSVYGAYVQQQYGVSGASIYAHNNVTAFTQEIQLTGSIGQRFDWLAGGFYSHGHAPPVNSVFAVNPTTGQFLGQYWTLYFPSTLNQYAAFADLTYHFTDQFDVQLGARESETRETDPQTIQPRAVGGPPNVPVITAQKEAKSDAFTYLLTPRFKVSQDLMVYARLASGYRPGGANNFGVGAPPEYYPDKTYNYEIGAKGAVLNVLSFDASVYYIDWKNLQLQLRTPQGFVYQTNGSQAKSDGVELSTTIKPLTGMTLTAWFDYDQAVLTQNFPIGSTAHGRAGDRLPNTARLSGSLSIQQDFPLSGEATGFLGATVTYLGDRVSLFTGTAQRQIYPAYTKTDLRSGVTYNSWIASLYVTNASDVRGILSGGLGYSPNYAYYYIQPRTVGLSLVKSF